MGGKTLFGLSTSLAIICSICGLATCLRFVGLEASPPGFYADEAAIAAQVICLRQSGGTDSHGNRFPIFSQVLGGGYVTPAYLYGGALWTLLAGDSIAAFRLFAAIFGVLTVIGVFFLARAIWQSSDAAWFCTLCAAVSPWGFLFSRIAWDPPLAPCFLVWSFYFFLKKSDRHYLNGILAGVLLALSMYSYPPTRVQAIVALPFILFLVRKMESLNWPKFVAFAATATLVLLPLGIVTLNGTIQGRFNALSIFNEEYLRQYGGFSLKTVTKVFLENIALHFSPRFLFFTGDGNLRHSTQFAGEWSYLDIFALLSAVTGRLGERKTERREGLVFAVFAVLTAVYFAGIVPAALTWESNPHALRSIGAYPFLALLSGWFLYRFSLLHRWAWVPVSAVALIFFSLFFHDLMTDYPKRAELWFDAPVTAAVEAASAGSIRDSVRSVAPDYADLAILYHQLRVGEVRCGVR